MKRVTILWRDISKYGRGDKGKPMLMMEGLTYQFTTNFGAITITPNINIHFDIKEAKK